MESLRTLLLFVVCFTAPAPCVCQIYPEGCLDCWYRACNEFDTNFNSGAFRIDCCYCVLDESADIDLERCTTQLTLYYRMANVVRDECCSNARDRFLTYDAFVEDSPPADTELCRGGPLFNSPETVSDRQLGPGASLDREEYLLPQYTFECSGCIENFTILVSAPETPVIQEGNVTVKLWSSIRSSLQGSSTFYRLNGSTSFVASPQVDPPAGRGSTGRWLVTFGLPSSKPLCFVEGHTLGFSLKEHPIASLAGNGTALTVLAFSTENKTQNVMVPYVDDDCELNGLFEARSSSEVNQLPWIAVGAEALPTSTPQIPGGPFSTSAITTEALPTSTPQIPGGPFSTSAIVGITVGGVGGVAILVLLLIVLLWKCHSRKGDKALQVLKLLALQNTVFEVKEPVYETTSDMVGSETYYTEIHSQHDETHSNENYIQIHSQHNTTHGNESYEIVAMIVPTDTHLETHGNEAYQTTATSDPTQHIEIHGNDAYQTIATADPTQHIETHGKTIATADPTQHIETHGNEAYQTTATAISTQRNTTYGGGVDDPNDYKENAACGDQVDDQFADPTEHIETHGNEAYQTTATTISTQPNATYGGQMASKDGYKENAAYSSSVDDQDDYI